ncbi:tetratricopeptide repeat protein [Aquimarina agarilytica]|uniref:tetratricopeptide repeat protein n=1 Tax=Aquimarina agarilytica TaxID=1087449 RepID=UPI000288FD96|nr:tetratricopeptide repeat protein [Aquimarina agarilytica]
MFTVLNEITMLFIYRFFTPLLLILFCINVYTLNAQKKHISDISFPQKKWHIERLTKNDSSHIEWETKLARHNFTKDTIAQINVLNNLGELYCNRINYEKSYDSYWKALLLAEKTNNPAAMATSYTGIGILYSLYNRRPEALKYYLKSLEINKLLVKKNELKATALIKNYLPLATHYFYNNDPETMRSYLETAELITTLNNPYINFLKVHFGYLSLLEKNYAKAIKQLLPHENYFLNEKPSYLVVLYAMLGDSYFGLKEYKKAIFYYEKSNAIGYQYKNHLNFIPDTYKKLSEVYQQMNNESKALKNLLTSLEINQYLYSSRSPNNQYLLEIKDQFMLEKERLDKLAAEQQLEQLLHTESLWRLRYIIMLISALFLVVLGVVIYRYTTTKLRNEKKMLLQKKELETKKSEEILEIKNKELTESTLRLMAKDELLNEVKTNLKEISEQPNSHSVKKLIKTISVNSKENWSEFESRFTMVNQGFYSRLKKKYPDLSQYDLKVCALIKLGFSGKEMAKVMGISHESANTSRYRLRKKINLDKNVNLVEFINDI